MQTPLGPSMHLMLLLVDTFTEVSISAVSAAWERWIGPQRFRRKLSQFARQGWLELPAGPGELARIVRLTNAGRLAALGGRDPEACWRRAWDGRWRMVLFDVPEVQRALRNRLGRKLRTLGFGYLQHSVWISPDPVEALRTAVRGAKIDVETLLFMEARPCGGESPAELVQGAWDFARINRGYGLYLDVLQRQPARVESGRAWREWFAVEWKAWEYAVRADPLLPEVLLPPGYRGRTAWQRRREAFARVFPTA